MAAGAAVTIPAAAAAERRFLIHISIKKGADDLLPFFMDVKKRPCRRAERTAKSLPPGEGGAKRRMRVEIAPFSPRRGAADAQCAPLRRTIQKACRARLSPARRVRFPYAKQKALSLCLLCSAGEQDPCDDKGYGHDCRADEEHRAIGAGGVIDQPDEHRGKRGRDHHAR